MGDGTEPRIKPKSARYKPYSKTTKQIIITYEYNNKTKHYKKTDYQEKYIKEGRKGERYENIINLNDDGNAREQRAERRIFRKNFSKSDIKYGVQKKTILKDGTIKRRYKQLDVYESTMIYDKKKRMMWQTCVKVTYMKDKRKITSVSGSELHTSQVTREQVKKDVIYLMARIESYYKPLSSKTFIRYFDYLGGTKIEGKEKEVDGW